MRAGPPDPVAALAPRGTKLQLSPAQRAFDPPRTSAGGLPPYKASQFLVKKIGSRNCPILGDIPAASYTKSAAGFQSFSDTALNSSTIFLITSRF